ncbi:hypothetical protein C4552_02315 [Candidatus Parcubacteria bacterium]|nr:MAG: hypothetical protein C4552_02315 [Candidatus Parcubacteria bacterium]
MFLVFNTVALPIVFGTGQPEWVKFVISLVGLFVHLLILSATGRANNWIAFFDARLAALEEIDQDGSDSARVKIFSDPEFEERRSRALASRRLFSGIGIFVALVWLVRAIYHAPVLFR